MPGIHCKINVHIEAENMKFSLNMCLALIQQQPIDLMWHTLFFTSNFLQILKVLIQNYEADDHKLLI